MELRSINPSALAGERSADDDAPRAGRWRTKRSGGRLVRVEIVIALACCAVTMVGVVYLGAQFFDSRPQPPQPQAKGIVWAGRTFVDLAQFSPLATLARGRIRGLGAPPSDTCRHCADSTPYDS